MNKIYGIGPVLAKELIKKHNIDVKKPITPLVEAAPVMDISEAEKEELEKTEAEMKIEKKEYICIVHKGPIKEDNIYLCPNCDTFYCVRCAQALKEKLPVCALRYMPG